MKATCSGFVLAVGLAWLTPASTAELAFLHLSYGRAHRIVLVYEDGRVYQTILVERQERNRVREGCSPTYPLIHLRYLSRVDYDTFRSGEPALVLDPAEVRLRAEQARKAPWEYEYRYLPITDIGVGCSYVAQRTTEDDIIDLRLIALGSQALFVRPATEAHREIHAWFGEILEQIYPEDAPRLP